MFQSPTTSLWWLKVPNQSRTLAAPYPRFSNPTMNAFPLSPSRTPLENQPEPGHHRPPAAALPPQPQPQPSPFLRSREHPRAAGTDRNEHLNRMALRNRRPSIGHFSATKATMAIHNRSAQVCKVSPPQQRAGSKSRHTQNRQGRTFLLILGLVAVIGSFKRPPSSALSTSACDPFLVSLL